MMMTTRSMTSIPNPSSFVRTLSQVWLIASIVTCLSVGLLQWDAPPPSIFLRNTVLPSKNNDNKNDNNNKNDVSRTTSRQASRWESLTAAIMVAPVVTRAVVAGDEDATPSSNYANGDSNRWSLQHFGIASAFPDDLYIKEGSSVSSSSSTSTTSHCPARRFHLTQQSNVVMDPNKSDPSGTVNMTVSFTLAYPDCRAATVTVWYGQVSNYNTDDDSPATVHSIVVRDPPIQVQYNASLAVPGLEDYHTDYIYHVTLPQLEADRVQYWYSVQTTTMTIGAAAPVGSPAVTSQQQQQQQRRADSDTNTAATADSIPPPLQMTTRQQQQQQRSFTTPPLPTSPTGTTVLAFVGDLGQTENSTKTMKHIYDGVVNGTISSLIIAGDLSYADGDPYRWTRWFELMEPLLSMVPLFSVPGNHEIECDASTNQVFQLYEAYVRNPNRMNDDIHPPDIQPIPEHYKKSLWSCLTASQFLGHYNYGNAFWSVQHGLVHVIGLNSYTSVLPDSPQYVWLEQELEQGVNRTLTPWLVVVFHCPLHTTFIGHNGEINPLMMLQTIEPLLVQYQVNLVVSGHDHAYLRTHPMVGETVNASGPVYWTLGAGGNREQHNKGYLHDIPEEWVGQRDLSDYGYGQFLVANATHAQLTWVKDGTTTMGVNDQVWMENILQQS